MLGLGRKDKAETAVDANDPGHTVDPVLDSNDEGEVRCPPHTTETKLLWKIDLHVVPFLCIMYLLAFLG